MHAQAGVSRGQKFHATRAANIQSNTTGLWAIALALPDVTMRTRTSSTPQNRVRTPGGSLDDTECTGGVPHRQHQPGLKLLHKLLRQPRCLTIELEQTPFDVPQIGVQRSKIGVCGHRRLTAIVYLNESPTAEAVTELSKAGDSPIVLTVLVSRGIP